MKYIIFTLSTGLVLFSSCKSGSIKDPEYRDIRNIRLITAGLLESVAGMDLIYYNPNKFSSQLKDLQGKVYINNSYFGKFEMQEKVQMIKRSEFTLPATIKLDMLEILKNQKYLLKNKEATVRIEGTARVQKAGVAFNFPIIYEGRQNIEQLISIISK